MPKPNILVLVPLHEWQPESLDPQRATLELEFRGDVSEEPRILHAYVHIYISAHEHPLPPDHPQIPVESDGSLISRNHEVLIACLGFRV